MAEYVVEVTPGRETVYTTAAALRAAMRGGEITPDSRVYHRAAARWLSILEHPEYRRFLAERRPADWLRPIPFQAEGPQPKATPVRALLSSLAAVGRDTWHRLRHIVSRSGTGQQEQPARAVQAVPPTEPSARTLAGRRWTFLP
jgi:hypothetical protein